MVESTHLQLGSSCEHLLETDTDALDDGKEDSTANGTVPRRLVTATNREGTACEETGNLLRVREERTGSGSSTYNRVVPIILLAFMSQSCLGATHTHPPFSLSP